MGASDALTSSRRPRPPTGVGAVLAAARSCSTTTMRGKRRFVMIALFGIPLLIETVILIWGDGRGTGFHHFVDLIDNLYLRVIVPVSLIYLGTGLFGDEWEGGTASYVVGTPVPRWAHVIGRWLAASQRALVIMLPALVLLYVLCLASHEGAIAHYVVDLLWVLLAVCLVSVGYLAVFLFIGMALKRAVMTSLVYVVIFEVFISSLPSGFAAISLSFHVRNLAWWMTGHEQFQPPDFGIEDLAPTTAFQSVLTIAVFIVLFLGLASWLLRRKEVTGSSVEGEGSAS